MKTRTIRALAWLATAYADLLAYRTIINLLAKGIEKTINAKQQQQREPEPLTVRDTPDPEGTNVHISISELL